MGRKLKEKIVLNTFPVGVKFVFSNSTDIPIPATRLTGHRYCQALMKARHGEHVILDSEGIACPAAAAAFGFKSLPEGLKNGKGLIGFGITQNERTGKEMFEGMTVFNPGEIKGLILFPLETATIEPDVIVIEDQIEKLMWVALAYLNSKDGKRVESSTAILQATCVDATIIPYKQQKMNMSYGCYGCRDATDIETGESVLGFPFKDLEKITGYIEYLSEKAIPHSRGKNAYSLLRKNKQNRNQ
jgi:uncharacterized protein (DUF169 family)